MSLDDNLSTAEHIYGKDCMESIQCELTSTVNYRHFLKMIIIFHYIINVFIY